MAEEILLRLAVIVVLGTATQLIAWQLRLPAILLLLVMGLCVGAGTEWLAQRGVLFEQRFLDPDALFGDLLLPMVSLAVALILFEGGLTLNLREFNASMGVIARLVSVGGVVTWFLATMAAHWIVGIDFLLAILLGAVLVVTGPTVIGPLLRHVRPSGAVGPILKWEGIVIDPLGAMLAVVVFEVLAQGHLDAQSLLLTVVMTGGIGCGLGFAGAGVLILLLRRSMVPDILHNPMTLMLVVAAFATANLLQHESGLFAVTVMGLVLANQRYVPVRHIMEFKESLTVLLLSALFIVLGSRLQLEQLAQLDWRTGLFILVLIVVVRPAAVALCTMHSTLPWQQRLFLAAVAPRGIVAAAVSSVFALRLKENAFPEADRLVPLTFAVIIGTVTIYGLAASRVAQWLGLAKPGRLGFLIVSADPFARQLAKLIQQEGFQVLMVDTNRQNVQAARLEGLTALAGSALSPQVLEKLELSSIGRLLALTPNDEVNSLAALHYAPLFGRAQVYQLAAEHSPGARREEVAAELQGRRLFAPHASHTYIQQRLEAGAQIKKTTLTREFDYERFKSLYGAEAVPMLTLSDGHLTVVTEGQSISPRPGQTLVSLVNPAVPVGS